MSICGPFGSFGSTGFFGSTGIFLILPAQNRSFKLTFVPAIAVSPDDSPLLKLILRARAKIRGKLAEREPWDGIRVIEPESGEAYLRVVCRDLLVTGTPERDYRLAVHEFGGTPFTGRMHDHRWPLAVLALGAGAEPLYEMPWERVGTTERGVCVVRPGDAYAIDDCTGVRHAVHSKRPHLSIVLTDVTDPARRENRLRTEPMTEADARRVLDAALASLGPV